MELSRLPAPGDDPRSLKPLRGAVDAATCAKMLSEYLKASRDSLDAARLQLSRWRAVADLGAGAGNLAFALEHLGRSLKKAAREARAIAVLEGIEIPEGER